MWGAQVRQDTDEVEVDGHGGPLAEQVVDNEQPVCR